MSERTKRLYERLDAIASRLPADARQEFADVILYLAFNVSHRDEVAQIVKRWRKVNGLN